MPQVMLRNHAIKDSARRIALDDKPYAMALESE